MSEKILWRKVGGGFFRMFNGKIIKPNQVFSASIDDIPKAFRDCIRPVDEKNVELVKKQELKKVEPPIIDEVKPEYEIKERGRGWYDVVDVNGKTVNESALRESDAKELLESIS